MSKTTHVTWTLTGIRMEQETHLFCCSSHRHYVLCCNDHLDMTHTVGTYHQVPKVKTVLSCPNCCVQYRDHIQGIMKTEEGQDSSDLSWSDRKVLQHTVTCYFRCQFNDSPNPTWQGILRNVTWLVSVRNNKYLLTVSPILCTLQIVLQGLNWTEKSMWVVRWEHVRQIMNNSRGKCLHRSLDLAIKRLVHNLTVSSVLYSTKSYKKAWISLICDMRNKISQN